MTKILKVGDTRPFCIFTVKDANGSAIDFSAIGSNPVDSAVFHVRFQDEGTDEFTRAAVAYTDYSDGKFKLVWTTSDFNGTKLGLIDIWLVITFNSSADILTTSKVTWELLQQNIEPTP